LCELPARVVFSKYVFIYYIKIIKRSEARSKITATDPATPSGHDLDRDVRINVVLQKHISKHFVAAE
jgi:hypothetical protein